MKAKKIEQMELIVVDAHRISTTVDIYFEWKQLDAKIRTLSTRGINFPSELSEYFTCYALGYKVNKGTGGDAIDDANPNNQRVIEIKASSAESDTAPSSFSPSEKFDELIYARLDKSRDCLLIYKTGISSEDLKEIKVNETETVADQQKKGRRPRFSIQKKVIEPRGIKPVFEFDIRDKKVKKLND